MSLHLVVEYSADAVRINLLADVANTSPQRKQGFSVTTQPPTLACTAGWFLSSRVHRHVHHETDAVYYFDSLTAGKMARMPWIAASRKSTYSLDFRQLQSGVMRT